MQYDKKCPKSIDILSKLNSSLYCEHYNIRSDVAWLQESMLGSSREGAGHSRGGPVCSDGWHGAAPASHSTVYKHILFSEKYI